MTQPQENDQAHALRLQLQEMGALDVSPQTVISLCTEYDADTRAEREQGTQSNNFECAICLEEKQVKDGKKLGDCDDLLCVSCSIKYIEGIVALPVPCPTCREPLNPELCLSLLQETAARERFARLISESHCERLRYCANKECNHPFDWIQIPELVGTAQEFRVTCPLCSKQTCVQCRVEWHENQTCEEYKNNNNDIHAVGELARRNNWMPCPSCNALVEKKRGDCNYVRCLCGTAFCHNCGVSYLNNTPRAGNQHGQPGCNCALFAVQQDDAIVGRRVNEAIAIANRRQFGQILPHYQQGEVSRERDGVNEQGIGAHNNRRCFNVARRAQQAIANAGRLQFGRNPRRARDQRNDGVQNNVRYLQPGQEHRNERDVHRLNALVDQWSGYTEDEKRARIDELRTLMHQVGLGRLLNIS